MLEIPFREDRFGKNFYIETCEGTRIMPYKTGKYKAYGIDVIVEEKIENDVLEISMSFKTDEPMELKRLGFRLGINTFMDKYPDWNDRFFPTALRCEKNGFWSCFVSPLRKMVSVCSPSGIVSWKNEYTDAVYDIVGHRIETSCVEFINTYPQPKRHPSSPTALSPDPLEIKLYYSCPETEEELYSFIKEYSGIKVPQLNKYTLEPGEKLIIDGKEYKGKLKDGINFIDRKDSAELSVFVRKDWFYYLDCARRSAEVCQQKIGTHCESWYGYFSRVLYAEIIKDPEYTKALCDEFDEFFLDLTEVENGRVIRKVPTLRTRLQNDGVLVSLLTDFFELTGDRKYADWANDIADYLITLQTEDGSYKNKGVHYTCVAYPAKSMLELAIAENNAGLKDRSKRHYDSAYRAIKNLEVLMDNIETEGQMTFEDGMISCESLQLAYLALLLPEGKEKDDLTAAAETIIRKHLCLEEQFLPDCRVRGCTLRFWESRYDINFFVNMLNTPHGWTSWKNYATYYLYLLTGKLSYLKDTMDTMGACMQCVDKDGVLNWAYVLDPCVTGDCLQKGSSRGNIIMKRETVGEEYLPMISDWWRIGKGEIKMQYLEPWDDPSKWDECYGGSCDNDVHEHFKCLAETVLGKAFVHEDGDNFLTYNCKETEGGFKSDDSHLTTWVVYVKAPGEMVLNGKAYSLKEGMNFINL